MPTRLGEAEIEFERRSKEIEARKRIQQANPALPDLTEAEIKHGRALRTCEWLYGILNTLDAKASALMRLNGVMVAAATFLHAQSHELPAAWALAISATASTISIACCLLVVSLDWSFYQHINLKAPGKPDFSEEVFHLQHVAIFREKTYRTAWVSSSIGILSFLCALLTRSILWSSHRMSLLPPRSFSMQQNRREATRMRRTRIFRWARR